MSGRVYLVGAGPWDPALITLRGQSVLADADVVLFDYLVNPAILRWAKPSAKRVCVGRPPHRMTQAEICRYLVEHAKQGCTVVRLKGGDPFVFGRGGEEAQALASSMIDFEVVPGVTAAVASAAYAGIPVTHRDYGSTLAFCTGHLKEDGPDEELNWSAIAAMDTIVFYMAARRISRLRRRLLEEGRAPTTPVALVQWATSPRQQTVETTLQHLEQTLEQNPVSAPIIVIVGEVVELRATIQWFEKRPLLNRRIIVTRSAEQSETMLAAIERLGAEAIHCPSIRFDALDDTSIDHAIRRLGTYDWVVFTSTNGVRFFVDAIFQRGFDLRIFGGVKLACIGPATADALRQWGLVADLIPETYVAEGLVEAFEQHDLSQARICLPRARVAREVLPKALRVAGAQVDVIPIYETKSAELTVPFPTLMSRSIDLVTFTAASTVRYFCKQFSKTELAVIQRDVPAACIGPITAEAARSAGFRVDVVSDEYTIPGLVEAISAWGRLREEREN